MKVTRKQFAQQWQKGATIIAISKAVGLSVEACRVKASVMRRSGVPLKKFQRGRKPGRK